MSSQTHRDVGFFYPKGCSNDPNSISHPSEFRAVGVRFGYISRSGATPSRRRAESSPHFLGVGFTAGRSAISRSRPPSRRRTISPCCSWVAAPSCQLLRGLALKQLTAELGPNSSLHKHGKPGAAPCARWTWTFCEATAATSRGARTSRRGRQQRA